jgi:type I restriction-modification system DNA methylase subunit
MNIDSAVLDVLSNASMDGNSLKLTGQLDRPLYVATNKILEAAGGKWNRKAQAHVFDGDAAEIMDQIILTGKVLNKKQELGQFFSPIAVVERVIELAEISNGDSILEPSAGNGAILRVLRQRFPLNSITAVEIDESHTELSAMATRMFYGDFLDLRSVSHETGMFDRICMNPPFAKNASPAHVLKALSLLKPNGRLVSVMPSSVTFRTDKLNKMVRAAVDAGGSIEALPDNAFSESGTNVNTVIVTMQA